MSISSLVAFSISLAYKNQMMIQKDLDFEEIQNNQNFIRDVISEDISATSAVSSLLDCSRSRSRLRFRSRVLSSSRSHSRSRSRFRLRFR